MLLIMINLCQINFVTHVAQIIYIFTDFFFLMVLRVAERCVLKFPTEIVYLSHSSSSSVNFCFTYWEAIQFSSVAQSCLTLWDPMNRSTPGLPVHHQLPEFTQTHVHCVRDAIQPSHPRSSPSPPAPNPSQHQGLFQWVNSSHEVAKVLEFQLQHQSFQWTPRTDLL